MATYMLGLWTGAGPQSFGLVTVTEPLVDNLPLAGTVMVALGIVVMTSASACLVAGFQMRISVATSTGLLADPIFSTCTTRLTFADEVEVDDVVMEVPYWATRIDLTLFSQTLRYSPPPGYQRELSLGLSNRIAKMLSSPKI